MSTVLLSSCATLFAGGSPLILIEGNVDEPVTITTDKQVYNNVKLPAMVEVNRHAIEGKRIQISSEHYNFNDIVLQKKIEEWTWGNIAIGGLIGWAIDMGTNCVSKPKQTKYNITPLPKQ
ncbi:MAG: hypothetical protein IKH26_06875 [Bacteroidaceae bacterium]|nr:hypothetical protein [Bacteroidaceae bacterium]